VKYGQIAKIIKDIEKKYSASVPVILFADFNSLPTSNVIKFIYRNAPDMDSIKKGDMNKNRELIAKFWEEFTHHLDLRSAYDSYKSSALVSESHYANNHADFTAYTEEFSGTIKRFNINIIFFTYEKY